MKSDYLEDDWEDWDETNSEVDKCTGVEETQNCDSIDDQTINSIVTEIKGLLLNITDSNIHLNMNRKLHKTSYNQFIKYYQSNPNLANYTIQNELNRLQFTIIFQQIHYKKKEDIVDIYKQIPNHILWRMANQSIFSELLNIMQNTFPIKELYLSLTSKFCSFYLDFDSSILRTESVFSFQSLNQHSSNRNSNNSPSSNSSKLTELATIQANIEVNGSVQAIKQCLTSPSLSLLFDDQICSIATSIAQLHNDLSNGEEDEEGDDTATARRTNNNVWGDDTTRDALAVSKQILNSAGEVALVTGYGFLESMVASVGKVLGADASHRENSTAFSEVLRKLPPPPLHSPIFGVNPLSDTKVPVTTSTTATVATTPANDVVIDITATGISDTITIVSDTNYHPNEISSSKANKGHSECNHRVTLSQESLVANLKSGDLVCIDDNEKISNNGNEIDSIDIMDVSIPNILQKDNDSSQPATETWDDW